MTGRVTARAAAVIVLLATGSVATWRLARVTAVQPLREFVSAPGSRATITLHDGTGLQLAPASRLRVPADFGRGTRMVELEGQAYFAVVHDAAHPFVVRTARAEVRDVGTTFTVRAYADDPTERVAVADGEVALGAVSLRAHDAATVDSAGRVAIHHGVNLTSDFAWTQGRFVFNDTPLRDVARELSRAFNVTITVADSTLIGQHITGEFDDDAMDQVLDDVTDAIGARYERFGRTVTIRRRSSRAGWRSPGAPAPMSTVQATAPHE